MSRIDRITAVLGAALICAAAGSGAHAASCTLSQLPPRQESGSAPVASLALAVGEVRNLFVTAPGDAEGQPHLDGTRLAEASWWEVLPVSVGRPGGGGAEVYDEVAPVGAAGGSGSERVLMLRLIGRQPGTAKLAVSVGDGAARIGCGALTLNVAPVSLPATTSLTLEAGVWPHGHDRAAIAATVRLLQDYGFNAFARIGGAPETLARFVAAAQKYRPIKLLRIPAPKLIHGGNPESKFDQGQMEQWMDDSAAQIRQYEAALKPLGIRLAYEIWDEPRPQKAAEVAGYVNGMRSRVPEMFLQITTAPVEPFVSEIQPNAWIVPQMRMRPGVVAAGRQTGAQVWLYANRWHGLDRPPAALRLVGWTLWANNLDGYYFWGINRGQPAERADAQKMGPALQRDNLVYSAGDDVHGSVRLEMFRQGIEDYELLQMAGKCASLDPSLATNLSGIRQMQMSYPMGDFDMEPVHDRLLSALSHCRK